MSHSSVPTFTVHPGVARPPSPLMIIDNDNDSDDDDEDEEDEDEPSVPLEQYRAWLGKKHYCFNMQLSYDIILICSVSDEDSNMATSPMLSMDSDSLPLDEEERWLDALEKGELDDNGDLKKEVDESLLTARQVREKQINTETG